MAILLVEMEDRKFAVYEVDDVDEVDDRPGQGQNPSPIARRIRGRIQRRHADVLIVDANDSRSFGFIEDLIRERALGGFVPAEPDPDDPFVNPPATT